MGICKTEGIVLRTHKLGETSKIATLYTKAFGKMKVVAKGARSPKSKFGASLEPITSIFLVFYRKENRDLQTLSQTDIVHPFGGLKDNLEKLSYGSALCELTERLTAENESNFKFYRTLEDCLLKMEESRSETMENVLWHFQLKAIGILGYQPDFCVCVSCRKEPDSTRNRPSTKIMFSMVLGGLLCRKCSKNDAGAMEVNLGTVRFLESLRMANTSSVVNIRTSDPLQSEVGNLLTSYLEYHIGDHRKLKSLQVLEQMRRYVPKYERPDG